jgi:hypothetical protein
MPSARRSGITTSSLWSKSLPNGVRFELDDTTPGVYLRHLSGLGEFFLTSASPKLIPAGETRLAP